MSDPKRQHYVPQTYLRNFAEKLDKKWKIEVFDKKRRSIYLAYIDEVAFKKHMYTVQGTKNPFRWEQMFANNIEPLMKETLGTIIERSSNILLAKEEIIIDADLQGKLINIIWSQLFRTPKGMDILEMMAGHDQPLHLQEIKAELYEDASIEQREYLDRITITEPMKKESMLHGSQGIPRGAQVRSILNRMTWVVYKIEKSREISFHTGDHPICIYHPSSINKPFLEVGIADPETIIFYPINPQTLLAIYGINHFNILSRQFNGKCQWLNLKKEKKFVKLVNNIISENCIQHVYSYPNE